MRISILCAVVGSCLMLEAQTNVIWKQGVWSVAAPAPAECGTNMPMLQVNGPGSVFDSQNAAVLANLLRSLHAGLQRACPGVREVILSSGQTRRMFRLVGSAPAQAPTPPPPAQAAAPPPPAVTLNDSSFNAKGLHNEGVITNIYRGDFVNIGFDRDDMNFMTLYSEYLRAYGRKCDAHLPANKVEIMTSRCTEETVTRNGFGVEVSRYCSNWEPQGTGIYADPEMYEVQKSLNRLAAADTFRNAGRMLTTMSKKGADPIAGAMNMVGNVQAAVADMRSVVDQNACTSPALKRFGENLRLFALNKQPVKLGGQAASQPSIDPQRQNYARLIEDLIADHSRSWVMNRYMAGSATGVSVASSDAQGRPAKLTASYLYNGFNGRSRGSVTLVFSDGLPECMYFFDFPATCRTPSRRIVAAYAEGAYQQK